MWRKVIFITVVLGGLAYFASLGIQAARRIGVNQGYEPDQPIAYSHKIHAGDHQIPCLYCHFGAEKGRHAGIPPAGVCMNCHIKIKTNSPEVQKVKEAIENNRPIEWIKVHRLPDFAYFNHSQHVVVGKIACQECHGPVEKMTRMRQEKDLTMGWCLSCHRERGIVPQNQREAVNSPEGALRGRLDPALPVEGATLRHAQGTARAPSIAGMDCAKCHY